MTCALWRASGAVLGAAMMVLLAAPAAGQVVYDGINVPARGADCLDCPLGDEGPLTGAIFTTDRNGELVDGNVYEDCCDVFLNGGPPPHAPCSAAGLPDGQYYFQVTDPSGAVLLSMDDIEQRRFCVEGGVITHYCGTSSTCEHELGDGKCVDTIPGTISIQLMPFAETPNPGGVHKVWVTRVIDYDPSDPRAVHGFLHHRSKTDNFKCRCTDCDPIPPESTIVIEKYYDANANGMNDGEFPIGDAGASPPEPGFLFTVTVYDRNGAVLPPDQIDAPPYESGDLAPGVEMVIITAPEDSYPLTYTVCEQIPSAGNATDSWMQTEPNENSAGATIIDGQYCYAGEIPHPDWLVSARFGNVCIGSGGGHTLGFWSNQNGRATMENCADGGMAGALAHLTSLNLRNADGTHFDPPAYMPFRNWLLDGNATNMAYMLSVQMAAMELNTRCGGADENALIFTGDAACDNDTCVNDLGFAQLRCILDRANAELGANGLVLDGSPFRACQEWLKNALDGANNNDTFVHSEPCDIVYDGGLSGGSHSTGGLQAR